MSEEEKDNLFGSFYKFAPPLAWIPTQKTPSYSFVEWRIGCYRMKKENTPKSEFFLWILKNINSKWAEIIYQSLQDPNTYITESNIAQICNALLSLYKYSPGLYFSMFDRISVLLQRVGPKFLYQNLDKLSFFLSPSFDPNLLQFFRVESIQQGEFSLFWMNPSIIKDQKIYTLFQNLFTCAEPYPKSSQFFGNDNILSLINESLCKRKHHVDIFIQPCKNFFINKKRDHINALTSLFPEIRPVLFFLDLESVKSDKVYMSQIYSEYASIQKAPKIFLKTIHRIINDSDLLYILSKLLGSTFSDYDLYQNSLPKIMQYALSSVDDEIIRTILDASYFLVDDVSKKSDMVFIIQYKIIYSILKKDFYSITLSNTQYLFGNLKSHQLRCFCMDLLSLVFLKINETFLFSLQEAMDIINIIDRLMKDIPEVVSVRSRIKCLQECSLQFFNASYFSLDYLVILLLSNQKFSMIKEISYYYPKYLSIYQLFFDMKQILQKSHDISEFSQLIINQYFLSTSIDLGVKFSEPILVERNNSINPLDIIGVSKINNILCIINTNNDHNQIDFNEFVSLKRFYDLMSISSQINQKFVNFDDLFSTIIKNCDLNMWTKLSDLIGTYSYEILIIKGYSMSLSECFVGYLARESLLVAFVLSKSGEVLDKLSNSSIIKKFNCQNIKSNELDNKDQNYYDNCSMPYPESLFISLIQLHISVDHFSFESLLDLYLMDCELFLKTFNPIALTMPINILENVYPYSNIIKVQVHNSGMNLYQYFVEMISNHKIYELETFSEMFSLTDIVSKIKSECANKVISHGFQNDASSLEPQYNICQTKTNIHDSLTALINDLITNRDVSGSLINQFVGLLKSSLNDTINGVLMELIINSSVQIISKVSIQNPSSEMEYFLCFEKLLHFINHLKYKYHFSSGFEQYEQIISKIDLISQFIKLGLNSRFGYNYDFEFFLSPTKGIEFYETCIKYDYPLLMLDFLSRYQFDAGIISLNRALNCLSLGFLEDGVEQLEIVYNTMKMVNCPIPNVSEQIQQILTYPLPIDLKNIDTQKSFPSLYHKIVLRCHDPSVLTISLSRMETLNASFTLMNYNEELVLFNSRNGFFDDSFNLYKLIQNGVSKTSLFLKLVVTPALSFMHWNVFWRKLIRNSVENTDFRMIIQDLLGFFSSKQMYITLNDAQKRLNMHEDMISSSIILFVESISWEKRKYYLNQIKQSIQYVIRKDDDSDSSPRFSKEDLFILLHRIELQTSIIDLFISNKEPFNPQYEIITARNNTIEVGCKLIFEMQIGLVYELCNFPDISIDNVCDLAVDKSIKGNTLQTFLQNLKKLHDNDQAIILPSVYSIIYSRTESESSFVSFVSKNVSKSELRARIYLKAGLLNLAQIEGNNSKNPKLSKEIENACKRK